MSMPVLADLPADESYVVNSYLRVASIAIAVYFFIDTSPSVWRFYRDQCLAPRLTVSCILLILTQVFSIAAIVISNFGFFYNFTDASCRYFYLLPPIFKVLQSMVSQSILGIRAFNLSTRSRGIGYTLSLIFLLCLIIQWVATLYNRSPLVERNYGYCKAQFTVTVLSAWVNYAAAIAYDVFVTAICVTYLLKHKLRTSSTTVLSKLTKIMLYDGIGYFVFLTAINVVNLLLFRLSQDIQTAASSLGYVTTWIFSQHLLIHLHEASLERRHETIDAAYTISQTISSAQAVNRAFRTQFEPKGSYSLELTNPDFEIDSLEAGTNYPSDDPRVEVRIEKTVKVRRNIVKTYELEDYSRHGALTNASSGQTISRVTVMKHP